MSYRYNSTDKAKFSLHDCRTDHIELEDGRLTFFFPSGIFCTDYGDDWPNTGAASLEYNVDSMRGITFYAFRETGGQTVREEYEPEQLIEKVNSKEWELEFAYRYEGYQEVLHMCWIWQNGEPWTMEAQLFIGTKEPEIFCYDPPEGDAE